MDLDGAERGDFFAAIYDSSPDAVLVVDATGIVHLANPSVRALFGYEPTALVGKPIAMLLPEPRRVAHDRQLAAFFEAPQSRRMGVNLDLAGVRSDGSEFAVDVSLAPFDVAGSTYAAAFVRDASERTRTLDALRSANAVTTRLFADDRAADVYDFVVTRAREIAGADTAWLKLPTRDGLRVVAAAGSVAPALVGATFPVDSLAGEMIRRQHALSVDDAAADPRVSPQVRDLGLGAVAYVPLRSETDELGVLVVGRRAARPFGDIDVALSELFAHATAAAMALNASRAELARRRVLEEDERIARDLHDTTIQQLFAIGMKLEAGRSGMRGDLAERIDDAVAALDDVVRGIRDTILRLPERTRTGADLGAGVRTQVERATTLLGLEPRLELRGRLGDVRSPLVAEHAIQVLGEALSNVARHARATDVVVTVEVTADEVVVSVEDDGIGGSAAPPGNGLRNMSARAALLGGEFRMSPRVPRGTRLEWRVPLA